MLSYMFSGSPGFDTDHKAFTFLGNWDRNIYFCAVSIAALINTGRSLGYDAWARATAPRTSATSEISLQEFWHSNSSYRNFLLEKILLQEPPAIAKALTDKIVRHDFTPNGAVFVEEGDISVQ